jgi:hypothetical protein
MIVTIMITEMKVKADIVNIQLNYELRPSLTKLKSHGENAAKQQQRQERVASKVDYKSKGQCVNLCIKPALSLGLYNQGLLRNPK